jgi:hypothetical protein
MICNEDQRTYQENLLTFISTSKTAEYTGENIL